MVSRRPALQLWLMIGRNGGASGSGGLTSTVATRREASIASMDSCGSGDRTPQTCSETARNNRTSARARRGQYGSGAECSCSEVTGMDGLAAGAGAADVGTGAAEEEDAGTGEASGGYAGI